MTTLESKKLDEIAEILDKHIRDSCVVDRIREDKIDKLMPIVELIPALVILVEQAKVTAGMNERFAQWGRMFLTIGGVIGAMYAIAKLILRIGE